MKTIKFNNDAIDTLIWSLNHLKLYLVNLEVTNDSYPHERVFILSANDEGVKVCESDEDNLPIKNSTWILPYDAITSVTVL